MAATVRTETAMKANARKQLTTDNKTAAAGDPFEKLRLQCLARGCSGIVTLGNMFRIMDDDGNRKIEFSEFQKGLRTGNGISLSADEVKTIFKALDRDNSGTIDFDEFLIAVRPPMSKARQDVIMQAYRKLDKNGDGFVNVQDMEGVYDVSRHPKYLSGEMSRDELFKQFLGTFEGSGAHDGTVTKDEFINYYAGVSASIDNDIYFDLMMRNAWKL